MAGDSDSSAPDKADKLSRRSVLRGGLQIGGGAVLGAMAVKAAEAVSEGAEIKKIGLSRARPIAGEQALPAKVDVAIIGGGMVGTATALALAERGISVALFEKGVIAGEASGRAGGLIEGLFWDPAKMEMLDYSKRRWRRLAALTGEPTGFVQRGSCSLFTDPDAVEYAKLWVDSVRHVPNGGARILSAGEAAALAPGSRVRLVGGVQTPEDGAAEPFLAAPAMAIGARKLGAHIHQFCAVRGIERTAGRVSAVVTERGRVAASTVILCGGVWSQMMANDLSVDLPLVQCFAKSMSIAPFNGPKGGTVNMSSPYEVGWRMQYDGGYVVWEFEGFAPVLPTTVRHAIDLLPAFQQNAAALAPRFDLDTFWRWMPRLTALPLDRPGPFEETRIYEPKLQSERIDKGFVHLQEAMPVFRRAAVRDRWCGAMQMAIDNMPVLSAIDTVPGLFVGTGFMWGFAQGPGAGMALADLATGRTPEVDLKLFRASRFHDGTKLRYYA